MENRKREIIIICAVIIIQTIIFILAGINKSYIHMDEAYSLGLANYNKTEIQNNEDFYDNWHRKDYYEDYLAVQDKDIGKFGQVYENQKNDVHPPLYYLFLRFAMGFSVNSFSKWTGIILNIVIYVAITIFMYLILNKIFKSKEKAIIVACISSITIASITSAIYIRMYALATLNILITTFLHMKLIDSEKINIKLLVLIGISALIGSLTHYYYLFYLAMLYIIFIIKYIKEKKVKNLLYYTVAMVIAGIASLAIFPYSISHMFFEYRGQGVISKLTNIPEFLNSIFEYLKKINYFGFNNTFFIIVSAIAIIALVILYRPAKRRNVETEKNQYIKIIALPTLFYFILVSIASPWVELRYIMPICGVIFALTIYLLEKALNNIFDEKKTNIIISMLLAIILIMPIIFNMEPEVEYSDKEEIVEKLEGELNVPTLYLFKSQNNRFLDDIYLFSIIDESYIAKDLEYTEENINKILERKDISKGIVVFINEGQDNDNILKVVKNSINGKECTWLKRLNACDVYYLK